MMDGTVLFIDDNEDARKLADTYFRTQGINSVSVGSGGEALSWIQDNDARVILIDLALPEMDGLEIADLIRRNEKAMNKQPAVLAFFTGNGLSNSAVDSNVKRNGIRTVFRKGESDMYYIGDRVKNWLSE